MLAILARNRARSAEPILTPRCQAPAWQRTPEKRQLPNCAWNSGNHRLGKKVVPKRELGSQGERGAWQPGRQAVRAQQRQKTAENYGKIAVESCFLPIFSGFPALCILNFRENGL
jgi:hypothetical protein